MDPYHAPAPGALELEKTRGHVKILMICNYVMAGFSAVSIVSTSAMRPVLRRQMEAAARQAGEPADVAGMSLSEFTDLIMKWILAWVIVSAIAYLVAAICLQRRVARPLILVIAAFSCLSFPIGTILGIFTFVVLMKPAARALFRGEEGFEPLR